MPDLLTAADAALKAGHPADAVAHLAAWVSEHPDDQQARFNLAITLGDAGHPAGALDVLRATAGRLAHEGYLLQAMVVIKRGLAHAPDDATLLQVLRSLHVRGVRAKAGDLPIPPALKNEKPATTVSDDELVKLNGKARLDKATEIGRSFGPAGEAAIPLPMPLFSELDTDSFVETVKRLKYTRYPKGATILREGDRGDSLLVVASGHVEVQKGGQKLAKLGPGMVIGEMALITGAPRSATVLAHEAVETFQLERADVESLAQQKPQVAEELLEYCRKRLVGNLLNTSPLFKRFDDMTRYTLIDRFARKSFQPGQKLIEEGKPGEGLFVVAAGDVTVQVKKGDEHVTVATLKPGDVVGEIALLNDGPTTATVVASSRVGALFLPRDEFQKVLAQNPSVRDYLQSLSADRLKAADAAREATDLVDAADLIVL